MVAPFIVFLLAQLHLGACKHDEISSGSCKNGTFKPEVDMSMFPMDIFTKEEMADGLVVLPCLGMVFMFLAVALVCDYYFVPSIDVITEELGVSPGLAGATLVAFGGSAPELFIAIIGTFFSKTDVGTGTVVGSAVFNVIVEIAVCAFASAQALKVTPYLVVRDTVFYLVGLTLLACFFLDNKIEWWESVILLLWYIGYITFMKFEPRLQAYFNGWLQEDGKPILAGGMKSLRGGKVKGIMEKMTQEMQGTTMPMHLIIHQVLGSGLNLKDTEASTESVEEQKNKAKEENAQIAKEEVKWKNPVTSGLQGGIVNKIFCIIKMPLTVAMAITIPPVTKPGWRCYYPLTFIVSIIWMSIFAYCLVWWASIVGEVTGLTQSTLGITFIAAGCSVPDLVIACIVARAGQGDVAVSSSFGSNLFDITVGLPLPWLLFMLIYQVPSVKVSSVGIAWDCVTILLMLFMVIASIVGFKWKMSKSMGLLMMALYVVFIVVSVCISQCVFAI